MSFHNKIYYRELPISRNLLTSTLFSPKKLFNISLILGYNTSPMNMEGSTPSKQESDTIVIRNVIFKSSNFDA